MRLEVKMPRRAVSLEVQNTGELPAQLQVERYRWVADKGGDDQLEPTDDIVATPPILTLAPGQKQIIRVLVSGNQDPTREATYRVILQETALNDPPPNAVRALLRISMPLFITPERRQVERRLVRRAGRRQVVAGDGEHRQRTRTDPCRAGRGRGGDQGDRLPPARREAPRRHRRAAHRNRRETRRPAGTDVSVAPGPMRVAPWAMALTVLAAPCQVRAEAPVQMALEVTLNGETRGTVLLLRRDSDYLLSQEDARAWRLRVPPKPELVFRGQPFYALESLGLTVSRLDTTTLLIELRAEPTAFEASTESVDSVEFRLTPATWGGFGSYDLVATRVEGVNAMDGAFTLAAFSPYGSLSTQFVERNLWSDSRAARDTVRIGTTYRRDWAESMTTLEIGDTTSRPGAFGRALRYGGISMAAPTSPCVRVSSSSHCRTSPRWPACRRQSKCSCRTSCAP